VPLSVYEMKESFMMNDAERELQGMLDNISFCSINHREISKL